MTATTAAATATAGITQNAELSLSDFVGSGWVGPEACVVLVEGVDEEAPLVVVAAAGSTWTVGAGCSNSEPLLPGS